MNKKMIRFLLLSLIFCCFSFLNLNAQDKIDISKYSNHNLPQLELEADMLFLKKSYAEATQLYLKIADQNKDDGEIYYKLAKCYSHLKKPALAADFLVIAVNNGFNNFQLIKTDETFEGIRENVHFKASYQEVLNYGRSTGGDFFNVKSE